MLQRLNLLLFLNIPLIFFAQKPFVGGLEYNIANVDFISKDTTHGKLFIYALDSLVRINYLLEDGKRQESIHHLEKNKFISLLEIDGLFFAVQIKDTSALNRNYTFHKNKTRQTICGLKCREANVEFPEGNMLIFYTKAIDSKYFVGLNNAPGIPVKGQMPIETGLLAFELQQVDLRKPPIQLFIPDKKYKVLPLDDFLNWAADQHN